MHHFLPSLVCILNSTGTRQRTGPRSKITSRTYLCTKSHHDLHESYIVSSFLQFYTTCTPALHQCSVRLKLENICNIDSIFSSFSKLYTFLLASFVCVSLVTYVVQLPMNKSLNILLCSTPDFMSQGLFRHVSRHWPSPAFDHVSYIEYTGTEDGRGLNSSVIVW